MAGEEINARVRLTDRPIADLRHAFLLDDYPVDGRLSGEFHLYGKFETPFGFGRMDITHGIAYKEPFESATASLRFEGAGVRLDAIEALKGGGPLSGAAYVALGGHLLVQRFRPTRARRDDGRAARTRRRRSRACSTSPPRAAAGSRSRDTTSGSASATSSSATRASAR